jgi:hypothetical protein
VAGVGALVAEEVVVDAELDDEVDPSIDLLLEAVVVLNRTRTGDATVHRRVAVVAFEAAAHQAVAIDEAVLAEVVARRVAAVLKVALSKAALASS